MIEYNTRYSTTDEYDKLGRWARLVVFRDIRIGWINKHLTKEGKDIFFVNCYFPTRNTDTATEHEKFETLEESKKWIEEKWEGFRNKIK